MCGHHSSHWRTSTTNTPPATLGPRQGLSAHRTCGRSSHASQCQTVKCSLQCLNSHKGMPWMAAAGCACWAGVVVVGCHSGRCNISWRPEVRQYATLPVTHRRQNWNEGGVSAVHRGKKTVARTTTALSVQRTRGHSRHALPACPRPKGWPLRAQKQTHAMGWPHEQAQKYVYA